jgi:hypothetical protein
MEQFITEYRNTIWFIFGVIAVIGTIYGIYSQTIKKKTGQSINIGKAKKVKAKQKGNENQSFGVKDAEDVDIDQEKN